jgi:hypothetical protein
MAIITRTVTVFRCERCGYEWQPRVAGAPPPTVCASKRCKSPYWNRPRQRPPYRRGRAKRWAAAQPKPGARR